MTREENIRAILECNFAGFREDIIDVAVKNICELEEEPCEDCISRQAVKELFEEGGVTGVYDFLGIDDLPSVQPKPKTGHWIMHDKYRECSACKVWLLKDMPRNSYCPNCGAKMENEVDE